MIRIIVKKLTRCKGIYTSIMIRCQHDNFLIYLDRRNVVLDRHELADNRPQISTPSLHVRRLEARKLPVSI